MNDTAALIEALMDYFGRFVVVTEDQCLAVTLWAMHTHVFDAFSTTPYLIVTSAEPRSGKSRLAIECMAPVVPNPKSMVSMTAAVLFRIVSQAPTLLIDETDSIFKDTKFAPSEKVEDIRSILNAGYRKGTMVSRCAPGTNEVIEWPVYGPKALAGIGHLPVTIEDRGLCIRLTRRMPDEIIERFRFETGVEWGARLKPRLEEWGAYARMKLMGARPELPNELDDRAQDAYEVLVAIADMAGGEWGGRARAALVALRNTTATSERSLGMRLLQDMAPFMDTLAGEWVSTADLLARLYEHGEEPWSEWWRGKDGESYGKKASMGLARLLREHDVHPGQFWETVAGKQRGYRVDDLRVVLGRYMGERSVGTVEPADRAENEGSEVGRNGGASTDLESADLQGSTDPTDLNARSMLWGESEGYETGA